MLRDRDDRSGQRARVSISARRLGLLRSRLEALTTARQGMFVFDLVGWLVGWFGLSKLDVLGFHAPEIL